MAVLASDSFTRADAGHLGANWSEISLENGGGFSIASNVAVVNRLGDDASAYYNGVVWPNDHYSEAALTVVGTSGGEQGLGLAVRHASGTTTKTMYRLVIDHAASNNLDLTMWSAGSFSSIAQRTVAWSNGDVFRLEIQGSTLVMKQNGSQLGASVTNSTITSGNAGLSYSSTETSATVDNWAGGDFSAGAQDTPELWGISGLRASNQMRQLLAQ